tara:strand:+ start:140 stop:373 length:234 start_codon:yes stop_codon:yes gene_type:complete
MITTLLTIAVMIFAYLFIDYKIVTAKQKKENERYYKSCATKVCKKKGCQCDTKVSKAKVQNKNKPRRPKKKNKPSKE